MDREFYIWTLPVEVDESTFDFYDATDWMWENRSHPLVLVMNEEEFSRVEAYDDLFDKVYEASGINLGYAEGAWVIESEEKIMIIEVIKLIDRSKCDFDIERMVSKIKHIAEVSISLDHILFFHF